jgi:hypothetical protein
VAVGLLCVGAVVLLVYFLFFLMPSPIGKLVPAEDSYVEAKEVEVKADFSRGVDPRTVTLKVDGKDVTMKSTLSERSISSRLPLEEGKHEASLEVAAGGLMGTRSAEWSFVVDTVPPTISITSNSVKATGNGTQVEVSFKGKTDPGSTVRVGREEVPVSSKGAFTGKAVASRARSVEVTASDSAGNNVSAYIVTQKPTVAKGAHVSVFIASSDSDLGKMVDLVRRTELNALQIDLKDEAGTIASLIDAPLIKKANSAIDYYELDPVVDKMRFQDIYTICRIVVFKDPKLGKARPDLAVQDSGGGVWGKGQWMDPYSKEVWDYNVAVAVAAARAGFNEIQFDYVRFPSDGNTDACVYPNQDSRKPGEVIDGFLAYAREKLAPYNVFTSADVFGLTASEQGEMGIGQKVSDVAKRVDYISPMVYPSHYNPGEYKIKSPESNPGDTVARSIADFKKAVKGTRAKLRPWLQDFSLRVYYSPDMVRRQINACEEAGIKEWLLWDPDCSYSEDALEKSSS